MGRKRKKAHRALGKDENLCWADEVGIRDSILIMTMTMEGIKMASDSFPLSVDDPGWSISISVNDEIGKRENKQKESEWCLSRKSSALQRR